MVGNRHSIHAAITDAAGNLLYAVDDPYQMTLARSTAKPTQTLTILDTGAVERFSTRPVRMHVKRVVLARGVGLWCTNETAEPSDSMDGVSLVSLSNCTAS